MAYRRLPKEVCTEHGEYLSSVDIVGAYFLLDGRNIGCPRLAEDIETIVFIMLI
jgi:hypothetical protein